MPKKLSTPSLPDSAARPVWSPNGREIAFQGINEEDSWADIYIAKISPEGTMSKLRQLTDHPLEEVEPSWSPDGTEIAFRTNRADGGGIYKININSLKETRLTHSLLYDAEPTWSPDGEQIAYVKQKLVRSTHSSIYKMHSDGSNSTPVFEKKGVYAEHPDWAPWVPKQGTD
jgi:Tol biopolymer transport system component